jgi:hypothetical protein
MSDCNKCQPQEDCSCKQEALHISQICNPIECPTEECSESFEANCIIYTGEDIICNNVIVGTSGESIAQIVANVTAYFCSTESITEDIVCGDTTVVTAGTSINDALDQIVTYFCGEINSINTDIFNINNTISTLQGQTITEANVTFEDATNLDGCVTRTWQLTITGSLGTLATTTWSSLPICPPVQPSVYGLFAQTANSTTVTDPVSGSLVGAGVGTLTVGANEFQVGDSFRAKLAGHLTCSNTQELTIIIRDGNGNTIASTGLIDLKTSINGHWNLEIDFTIRSLGVTGELISAGIWSYIPNAAGQALEGSDFSDVNPIDTTISNTLDVIASFNLDESGANTIYSELFTLTKIY